MLNHTFAISAFRDSPYLEECIKSLKKQTVPSRIILCTSTPSFFLEEMAQAYDIPYYVRDGISNIQDDWNFAYEMADTSLVTIVHQDDKYHRDYVRYARRCWKFHPDTTVFCTDSAIIKNGEVQRPGLVEVVKKILRLPLRVGLFTNRVTVKRSVLMFGNPIICPSCTYHKGRLGTPLFRTDFEFALDWATMWELAGRPGRFVCNERRLLLYRVHAEAATKASIVNNRRAEEELRMYQMIWPKSFAKLLMHFYRKAYKTYDEV